jgi:hypothetical protein
LDHALDLSGEELEAWLSSLRAEQPVLAADLEALREERFLPAGRSRLPGHPGGRAAELTMR